MGLFQRVLLAVFFLLAPLGGALAQEAPSSLEIGVRYWLSTGKTNHGHDASSQDCFVGIPCGNPTSTLTYDNLGAHTAELYARKALAEGWFVKGNAGIGTIPNGRLIDQDFVVDQILVFETTSGLNGKLYYGTIDFGREQWKSGNSSVGWFAGYQHWNERLDAYGASNSGAPFFIFLNLPGDNVPVISNEQTWDSARVGLEYRSVRGRTRVQAELALIPYAKYRNEDSHWLRNDLGASQPNIVNKGQGRGVQLEFEVRRSFPDLFGVELGLGYRYWKLSSTDGTSNFGGESFPVTELVSERQGVMFSATKTW